MSGTPDPEKQEVSTVICHRWARAIAGLLGAGLLIGPAATAQADTSGPIGRCRCITADSRDFAIPADPPFTLPYERPDGPAGSGIYAIDW